MKKPLRVQIYLNKKKEFCFRIIAGNNKIVAIGESYKSRKGAMKTVKLIEGFNLWSIEDLTKQMPETYKIISDNSEIEFIKSETHRIKTDSKGKQTKEKLSDELMIFKYVKSQTKLGKEETFTKTDFEKYLKMGNIVKI